MERQCWWEVCLSVFCLLFVFHCGADGNRSPNIILILVDDVGAADVSYNVKLSNFSLTPAIPTPAIDYLAHEGISLTSYYTLPLCGPSRSALLTSIYPFRLGNPFPMAQGGDLEAKFGTFIHELKYRHYETHFIGKWGVDNGGQVWNVTADRWLTDPESKGKGPIARGFDTFYGLYNSAHNHYTKNVYFNRIKDWHDHDNRTGRFDDAPNVDTQPSVHSSLVFTQQAIKRMKENRQESQSDEKKPFFIHLSYTAAHDPLQAPEEYLQRPACAKIPNWRRRYFCALMQTIDDGVANITEYLKTSNLLQNTIIIFTSDNGGFAFSGGRNYPYKGMKGAVFEGSVHVPALIYGPRLLSGGGRSYSGLFHVVDWGPTLLSLIDQTNNKPFTHQLGSIDGLDLSSALAVPSSVISSQRRQSLVVAADNFSNSTAYIRGKYKLILGLGGTDQIAWEPDSSWTYDAPNRDLFSMGTELLVDTLSWISVELFIFEWMIHVLKGAIQDAIFGSGVSTVNQHPYDKEWFRQRNQTFPIVLPTIQWDGRGQRVFLFNLEQDPFERENIAFTNQGLVANLTEELSQHLAKGPPQVGAIHYQFRIFTYMVVSAAVILGLSIVGVFFCCCSCVRKKMTREKKKIA